MEETTRLRFIIAFIAISSSFHCGCALFFVQVEQTVSWGLFQNGWMDAVVLDPDDSGSVIYSIVSQGGKCPTLTIDRITGNVIYVPAQQETSFDELCKYEISAQLQGQVGHRNASVSKMSFILSMNNLDCSVEPSKDYRCFNGLREINVQVLENNKDKVKLAHFGEEMKTCGREVEYKVIIEGDSNALSLEEAPNRNTYDLWAKKALDREYKPEYKFKVECSWLPSDGEVQSNLSIPGRLVVLDENDNGPKTQDLKTYEIYDISFEPGTKNFYKQDSEIRAANLSTLLVIDRDTIEVNQLDLIVVNDTWNLLNITPLIFNVPRNYSTTGIFLKIALTNETNARKPWTGRYCVEAKLNDTTLISGFDSPLMIYLICLHWGEPHIHAVGDNRVQPSQIPSDDAVCGQKCKFYLSLTGAVCLVSILGLFIFFQFRVHHSKRRKCPVVKPGGLLGRGLIHGEDYSENTNNMGDSEYMSPNNGTGVRMSSGQDSDMYMVLDPKWEIPRSALALEQILGEGEFGRVLKGRLRGHPSMEEFINVAVKMLKDNHMESGKSCRQEFMAEFVLLKQVDHPNVIKLIGACTTAGGPLYLIMEYAELGSLRSFLRKCRKIESLSAENGHMSDTMEMEDASKYVVNPKEVLGFSWQIAKGMTYLSDMKMVHRDLAARNILVTQNKVCKISDFGLTRDIYVDDAYKKKSKDRVPVKWLAPECLADELYTTKSDVWAYGVLLWELATLGASPYPGIQSEQIYSLLKSGYRMQQPPNCSFELYCLMRACWATEPINRPTFHEIDITLSKLLEDRIDYLQLDIPLVSNPSYQYFNEISSNPRGTNSDMPGQDTFSSDVLSASTSSNVTHSADGTYPLNYTNIAPPPYINYAGSDEDTVAENSSENFRLNSPIKADGYESPIKKGGVMKMKDEVSCDQVC